ncbi:GGDEF domain-containing protein [Phaeobacter sp. C3_T13_0]|uniref:GGDEF domain-containing protein n=1 Tax=Phaeobacter cretensis TaxID=3342641 RepID=UPI0039BC5192
MDINHLPCGCLITSPDQKILSINRYFSEAFDWHVAALADQKLNLVLNKATQLFCESYVIPMVLREGQCLEVLITLCSPDGAVFPAVANVQKMPDGNLAWVLLPAENRNRLFKELEAARIALQEKSEQLEILARTDALTGLANRRDLEVSAKLLLLNADRSSVPVSLVLLDIDHFKAVNDVHGHDIGDQVICALADVLRSVCRESDIMARLGGDEFVCVLINTDEAEASALCHRIHEAVAGIGVKTCQITVSIGFSVKPNGAQMALSDMLKLADQCLYVVKRNGGNASHTRRANAT